ncbi:MAG: hypothetical protein U0872_15395 [Planctomycetaceae bacterium]
MNRFEKTKLVCAWTLGISLVVVAVLLGVDHFRSVRYGGPLSSDENKLLKLGGITAIASWLIPLVLPQLANLGKLWPFGGGGSSNSGQLGGFVNIAETLMGIFGINVQSVVDVISAAFRNLGLPTWFYFGIGWGPDKTYALNYGPVPVTAQGTLPVASGPVRQETNLPLKTAAETQSQQQAPKNTGVDLTNLANLNQQ